MRARASKKRLPYDVGPARVFLGEAEKTPWFRPCIAGQRKGSKTRARSLLNCLTRDAGPETTLSVASRRPRLLGRAWVLHCIVGQLNCIPGLGASWACAAHYIGDANGSPLLVLQEGSALHNVDKNFLQLAAQLNLMAMHLKH